MGDKIVINTGANSGIGKVAALKFATEEQTLVLNVKKAIGILQYLESTCHPFFWFGLGGIGISK